MAICWLRQVCINPEGHRLRLLLPAITPSLEPRCTADTLLDLLHCCVSACLLSCAVPQPLPFCTGTPPTLPDNAEEWKCSDQTEEGDHCHAMCSDHYVGTRTSFCRNGEWQQTVGSCVQEQGCTGLPTVALPANADTEAGWECSWDGFSHEADLCVATCLPGFTG